MSTVSEWVNRYKNAGFRPIPLKSGGKTPAATFDILEQIDFREKNNIGIFMGSTNGVICADCDDSQSQRVVSSKLKNMGLWDKLTIVRTPNRGGFHVYFKCVDVPLEVKTSYRLSLDIGSGELRLRYKSYVVAPGSVLQQGEYKFIQGGIDYFNNQPIVEWKDLAWLLPEKFEHARPSGITLPDDTPLVLPVRLIYRPHPHDAYALAQLLAGAKRGDRIPWEKHTTLLKNGTEYRGYPSTSEAEAALVMMLILAGWDFEKIHSAFDSIASPHYREAGNGYLLHVYNSAVVKLMENENSKLAGAAYHLTEEKLPWPSRSGGTDKGVFQAILSKAWQFNVQEPAVSYREISEHAAVSLKTAYASVRRLQKRGYLRIRTSDNQHETQVYDLREFYSVNKETLLTGAGGLVSNVPISDTSSKVSELWNRDFLGKTASLIYPYLTDSPISIGQLMSATGKTRNTVKTGLRKLFEWGLAEPIGSGHWVRGAAEPVEVAEEIGAIERAGKRRERHRIDREVFARWNGRQE